MEKQAVKGSHEVVVISNAKSEKMKDKMCYGGGGGSRDAELLSSWPPSRHYTCNFCKRIFKSAQALGGHMNVHRRARAMIRSQLILPISSPTPSPWLPNSITTAGNSSQDNEHHHFICPNPNPHWPPYTHHTMNPSPSNLSHHPMIIDVTPSCSLVTITHKNPVLPAAACNCTHMPDGNYRYRAELRTQASYNINCTRIENQINGLLSSSRIHQDDMVFGPSLDTTSRPTSGEDIDLELRLGL